MADRLDITAGERLEVVKDIPEASAAFAQATGRTSDTTRDLGALSGPVTGAAFTAGVAAADARAAGTAAAGSLATSALLSPALTSGEKSEATDVTLHRGIFLAGGPVHTAAFGNPHRGL